MSDRFFSIRFGGPGKNTLSIQNEHAAAIFFNVTDADCIGLAREIVTGRDHVVLDKELVARLLGVILAFRNALDVDTPGVSDDHRATVQRDIDALQAELHRGATANA